MFKIFVDGEAGTTGLQIYDRLAKRNDIEVLRISQELRKDTAERQRLINESDVTFLCLPDAAAVESAALCTNPNTVIIDASTAHRVNPDWTYGMPELSAEQRKAISTAKRIANPGCTPQALSLAYTRWSQAAFSPSPQTWQPTASPAIPVAARSSSPNTKTKALLATRQENPSPSWLRHLTPWPFPTSTFPK